MDIMVSICCTAYNHEKYIADALESFLMQKTTFPLEIIVHDDASTDRTAEIIKKYEKEHPDIIKPIYQTENQVSQGRPIYSRLIYPLAQGKYIALCEGDDYWTDPYKLQKQIDYLECNPQCSLCFHATRRVDRNRKDIGCVRPGHGDKNFTTEDVIIAGGSLMATSSMVYLKKLIQDLPDFYHNAPVKDYPLSICLSLRGEVHYIDQFMSAYRVFAENSWTSRMAADKKAKMEHWRQIDNMLNEMNSYAGNKYKAAVERYISYRQFYQSFINFEIQKVKSERFADFYKTLSIRQKARLHLGAYLPFLVTLSRKIRKIK